MAKTVKEIYTTIEKYVSKDALTWILKDCLSKSDLENISLQCRIQYAGSRTISQPADILARDVAQEFFKNPKARELIAHYLDAATQNETSIVSKTGVPELLNKLREPQSPMLATGQVGKFLWALLADERSEAVSVIPVFILKVLETVRKFTSLLQQLKKDESLFQRPPASTGFRPAAAQDKGMIKLQDELSAAKKELLLSQDHVDRLQKKIAQTEDELCDLQERYKTTLSEIQQLKHERNMFTKKIKELEHSIDEIKSQHKELENLERQLHQSERENKMLRHELERKDKEIDVIPKIKEEAERLKKTHAQLERKIKEYEAIVQEREEEIYKLKESVRREALVKKEAKKVIKSSTPRVGIFVDVQNIFYAAKERFESKLDFQKLLHETLQGRKLARAVAYVVKTPEINQTNFISTLESIGYEIKAKNLKIRLDGSAKGDWDLGIAIDSISMADKLDVVVLVSGDGDFVDLVRMLKARNIRVEVASFPHNTSGDLIDEADFHFVLDEKILL